MRYTYQVVAGSRGEGFVGILDSGDQMLEWKNSWLEWYGWAWHVNPGLFRRPLHKAVEKADRWCQKMNALEKCAQERAEEANALAQLYQEIAP